MRWIDARHEDFTIIGCRCKITSVLQHTIPVVQSLPRTLYLPEHEMDSKDLVLRIHGTKHKAVLAITGGGAEAIGELLRYGDGSNTLLEAVVPYDQKAFDAFVKGSPDKYCSPGAARDLAMAAFQRAIRFSGIDNVNHLVGVGASCSLAKREGERAGREHHAYIAVQTAETTHTYSLELTGKGFDRVTEEGLVGRAIINALAYSCGLEDGWWKGLHNQGDITPTIASHEFDNGQPAILSLLTGQLSVHNIRFVHAHQRPIIFAGSFNPFHDRHAEIAAKVHEVTGQYVDLEVCVHNVDKPALNYTSIRERRVGLEALHGNEWLGNIHFTGLPTFLQKAEHFPGASFVVGWDTFVRICDPKYGDLNKVIEVFERQDVNFIVFHRIQNGKSSTEETTDGLHPQIMKRAKIVSPNVLAPVDMSSSDLRKKKV